MTDDVLVDTCANCEGSGQVFHCDQADCAECGGEPDACPVCHGEGCVESEHDLEEEKID